MPGTKSGQTRLAVATLASFALLVAGCGVAASTATTSGVPYSPKINPSDFSTTISNPYLPFVPGTHLIYEGDTSDGRERVVTEVTRDTKKIMGVDTVVVHDTVTRNGRPIEDTYDWYAQDKEGNV